MTAPSKRDAMTIGEIARRAGVTTRTVRYYEEIGLLRRAPRGRNHYRTYTEQDIYGLRLLRRGKLLGLSLAEMRELANLLQEDPSEIIAIRRGIEVVTSHLEAVERKHRQLEAYRSILVREIARLNDLLQTRSTTP